MRGNRRTAFHRIQIQLVVKLADAVADVLDRISLQAFFIVKIQFSWYFSPLFHGICLDKTDHSCRMMQSLPIGPEELAKQLILFLP